MGLALFIAALPGVASAEACMSVLDGDPLIRALGIGTLLQQPQISSSSVGNVRERLVREASTYAMKSFSLDKQGESWIKFERREPEWKGLVRLQRKDDGTLVVSVPSETTSDQESYRVTLRGTGASCEVVSLAVGGEERLQYDRCRIINPGSYSSRPSYGNGVNQGRIYEPYRPKQVKFDLPRQLAPDEARTQSLSSELCNDHRRAREQRERGNRERTSAPPSN